MNNRYNIHIGFHNLKQFYNSLTIALFPSLSVKSLHYAKYQNYYLKFGKNREK